MLFSIFSLSLYYLRLFSFKLSYTLKLNEKTWSFKNPEKFSKPWKKSQKTIYNPVCIVLTYIKLFLMKIHNIFYSCTQLTSL